MINWLLHTLIATSGLILAVLIVREPVRKRFGSRVTYGLWLIPAARLFMPTVTQTVERSVPAATPLPLFAKEPVWMAHVATPAPSVLDRLVGWPTVLFVLWLGAAAGLFLSRMIAFDRDRRALLRSSTRVTRLGLVRLVHTPDICSPVALGILRPIVAVPADFNRIYGQLERRLVLEHELAHHRSGDLVANLFAFVLLCLQWFNPLAWVAHAAFRFDQEAACDARVLDKAPATDRASYGRAIAKAASGRALLFASALDRPTSLQRRLQSMVRVSSPTWRNAGRLLVIVGIAAALPLTASRAVQYVDVPAPPDPVPAAPHATLTVAPIRSRTVATAAAQPASASAPHASVARQTAVAEGITPAPTPHSTFDLTADDGRHFTVAAASIAALPTYKIASADGQHYIVTGAPPQQFEIRDNGQTFVIDGKAKRWDELTPSEKVRVQNAVTKANEALAKTHLDQAKLMRDLANVPDKAQVERLQRQLADAQLRAAETLRRIASERAAGREPDGLEAAIGARLAALRNVDLRGLETLDRQKLAVDVRGAEHSMQRAKAELARIQARIDADPRK